MMPVETGRSGGEYTRHGTRGQGGTHLGLGVSLQWDCPACGTKHETAAVPIEHGCPACGAGVPGTAGKAAPTSSPAAPPASPLDALGGSPQHARVDPGSPVVVPRRERPAEMPQAQGQETVYRILSYTGSREWIEQTLRRSLVGYMNLGNGIITAAIVDSVDRRQEDLLGMAKRQPGVWMGLDQQHFVTTFQPPTNETIETLRQSMKTVMMTSPVTPLKETPPVVLKTSTVAQQSALAEELHERIGHIGAYTLAMALTQFSTVVEDETMERDKYWSPQQCLGVANALLELIPKDWNPEPEATEPPVLTGD